jgi:competence protein ComEC
MHMKRILISICFFYLLMAGTTASAQTVPYTVAPAVTELYARLTSLPAPSFEWTAIDISPGEMQGDAHLLQMGNSNILLDTGMREDAKKRLLPFLKSRQVTNIEMIIISHPHNDHYQGVFELLKKGKIKIQKVYMNFPSEEQCKREYWGCDYRGLMALDKELKMHRVPRLRIEPGLMFYDNGKQSLKTLYVYDGINSPIGPTDMNDMSAIIMAQDDKLKFLFPGDLNSGLGGYLAQNAKDIEATFLKAPHHGTEAVAPNDFFLKVNPKVFIVPAHKKLWFSDRSKRIRELAEKSGYATYVNGVHGHITVKSWGEKYSVETEKEGDVFLPAAKLTGSVNSNKQ